MPVGRYAATRSSLCALSQMIFCASTWSFQKSRGAALFSVRVSSSSGRDASKIAPQVCSAFAEILVAAHHFVDGGHVGILHGGRSDSEHRARSRPSEGR